MLQAVTVAVPKLVLKNDAPFPSPGPEHEPQSTDADEAGLVTTVTWTA
jgi:hypothetical protein